MNRLRAFCILVCLLGIALAAAVTVPQLTRADTVADLQSQISDKQKQIDALNAEIAEYEKQLTQIGSDKKSLQNTIAQLDLSRKKLTTQISATQQKIGAANLKITELSQSIGEKQKSIQKSQVAVAQSIRALNQIDDRSLAESLLASDDLSSFWEEADNIGTVQSALQDNIATLQSLNKSLSADRDATNVQKAQLVSFNQELGGQKSALDSTRAQQNTVLTQTKNKESEYQKQLAAKVAARDAFEQEVNSLESKIKFTLDPSSIPSPGKGILNFPLDPAFMTRCQGRQSVFGNIYCITQYFGDTAFAKSGAYNGKGHNGIDFGSPTGTKVVSVLGGTVVATGNTDLAPGCYSYGKWVLVKHANNLSSLYAHLSSISVSQGQSVGTGDLIGFSGMTGYATGPHLHFGLFVANAVQIQDIGAWYTQNGVPATSPCAKGHAVLPVAPTAAYLNAMEYF